MNRHLVFDVESVGLYGEGFAVAWVVLLSGGRVSEGWAYCDVSAARGSEDGRKWVKGNVQLTQPESFPAPLKCVKPRAVRDVFWGIWQQEKAQGASLWADVAWPVEARFLIECVEDVRLTPHGPVPGVSRREQEGPYPLLDISTALVIAGDAVSWDDERRPDELPEHHPLADARYSARLLTSLIGTGVRL